MAPSRLLTFIFLISSFALSAQTNRYIVYLKDKVGTPFALTKPEQFLSQRSIQRRVHQKIDVMEEDLPISPTYREQLQATGARVFFSSKWMNCILVETTSSIISSIALLPFVSKTELVAPGKKLTTGRSQKFGKTKGTSITPATNVQLGMIGIDSMHLDGYKGEGISVAVFDSGFQGVDVSASFKPMFQENRFAYSFDFISNSKNVFQYDDHGTEVLSVMAAYLPGSFAGGVYQATFTLFVTEDIGSEYRVEEYNWLFAAEKADSAGVDIINSSLGYNLFDDPIMNYDKTNDLDGSTALVSLAAKKSLEKGMMVVCSAGNEGSNSWKLVTPPADVDGVLAIGSVTSAKVKSSFSSIGPTSDGRVKPDVVALGSGTSVITAGGVVGTSSGTSVAAPLISSLAAGIWQRYSYLTSSEVYDAIINSADQALQPDQLKGYGIPNYNVVKRAFDVIKIDEEFVIYPNPTTDSIKIVFQKPEGQSVIISIVDLQGKLLSEYASVVNLQTNPLIIDMSTLSAGLYIIKINVSGSVKTFRIPKL